MIYGVTPEGFRRKPYEVIFSEMENRAKQLMGPDIDLSETTPDGMKLRNEAYEASQLWQVAEDVYNSGYADTAEGVSLNHTGKYIGINKKKAEKATTPLIINGDPGTIIPAGFKVETPTKIGFETIEQCMIGEDGTVTTTIKALIASNEGNVPANTITVISQPLSGVENITNPEKVVNGQDEEDDPIFRDRYFISVEKAGSTTVDSIKAKLLNDVPGVRAAEVYENDTLETDAAGRPGKSVSAIVLGGNAQEIADTIFKAKAGGIQAYGSTVMTVKDIGGKEHQVGFTYATQRLIYARIDITKTNTYAADGDDQVKLAFIKHIGGTDAEGTVYTGLTLGNDVVYNKIIPKIDSVLGIDDFNLEISADGVTYVKSNIPIGEIEDAETNWDIVVVTSHE